LAARRGAARPVCGRPMGAFAGFFGRAVPRPGPLGRRTAPLQPIRSRGDTRCWRARAPLAVPVRRGHREGMASEPADPEAGPSESPDVVATLVANHRQFLAFLERRVGSRALAEDILQDAFVRGMDKLEGLRSEEAAVGWFYRVLRNAVVDHQRRRGAAERKLAAFGAELEATGEAEPELRGAICGCVARLADTLKPEYAEVLRRVEVEGDRVADYAQSAGISASNAGVRIFRARKALLEQVRRSCGSCAEHGCLDCTCGTNAAHGSPAGGCGHGAGGADAAHSRKE